MSYRINHRAVQAFAAREYGIIGPITIHRIKRRKQENGLYNMRWRDWAQHGFWLRERNGAEYVHHMIRVDGGRAAVLVAQSIAHELQHAAQVERIIVSTTEAKVEDPVVRYLNPPGIPYWDQPCEVEARAAGKRLGPKLRRKCFA